MSPELRRFPFLQLDVFTSRPFEGNSLAVFPDGRGLSDQQMQALAREMNLSETTFILPREQSCARTERGQGAGGFSGKGRGTCIRRNDAGGTQIRLSARS